jgi:ABC-type glycerol-3-phosphate transport system permease component
MVNFIYRIRRAFFYLFIALLCFVVILPIYVMFVTSVQPKNIFQGKLIPHGGSLMNYRDLVYDSRFPKWLINGVVIVSTSSLFSVVVAALAGYAISRFIFPGRFFISILILGMQMISTISLLIAMFSLFMNLRLINTFYAIFIAYSAMNIPVSVWLLKGFYDGISPEIEHAALVDGCSQLQAMVRITIPLTIPGVVATFFYCFMQGWNEYLFASVLLNSSDKWTATVGLYSFMQEYTTSWGDIMSGAVLISIPTFIVFAVLQRSLVSGLTLGSIK